MLDKAKNTSPFNRKAQHEQKSQLILSEAAMLFNTKGTRATRLMDIAARLNLTKTSLYYYVKTKEDLIYRCYLQTLDCLSGFADQAAGASTGKDRLLAFARNYMHYWRDVKLGNQPHIALLAEVPTLKGKHLKDVMGRINNLRSRIGGFIEDGMADGTVDGLNPELAGQSYISMVQWTMAWLEIMGVDKHDFAVEQFEGILSNGLAVGSTYPLQASCAQLPENDAVIGFDKGELCRQKLDAFLRVGTRFFNDKGYKGTSIDEIAEALNATKGAFYYHIKNKEELLLKCFDRTLIMMADKQAEADQKGKSGREKLEISTHTLYAIQTGESGPLMRFTLLNALDQKTRIDILKRTRKISDCFGRFVAEGQRDGSIRMVDAFVAEQMITGAIGGAMPRSYSKKTKSPASDSIEYFAIVFRGFGKK